MATIQEVAKQAGVSVGSVSGYLNGHKLRPQNAKKIAAAIEALDYKENFFAKGLKSSETHTIGLLMNNMQSNFSAALVAKIDDVLEPLGYSLLLSNYRDDPQLIPKKLNYFASRAIDGLIIVGAEQQWPQLDMLKHLPFPIVSLITPLDNSQIDSIVVDNRASTTKVLAKMLELGHERIGVIVAPQTDYVARERFLGILDAFEAQQQLLAEELIYYGDYSKESGARGMAHLLTQKVTAVFVCNYNMSLGALQTIHTQQIHIGSALSFASYDYFDASDIFYPQLTVIKQPIPLIGQLAVERLLEKIRNQDHLKSETFTLTNTILWRDSIVKNNLKSE
ncbi:LacI family DNA-binding transcriptional regulator [Brochothrix campestris]|uniref:LacI family DNA-binding transcriptional regulator n=1 Tax=Brochothrix campestris TaxID=2757 RepID=UPI0038D05C73